MGTKTIIFCTTNWIGGDNAMLIWILVQKSLLRPAGLETILTSLLSCFMKNGLTRLMGSSKHLLASILFMLRSMVLNFKIIGFEKMICLNLKPLSCGRKPGLLIAVFPLDYVVSGLNSFLNTVELASAFNGVVTANQVPIFFVMSNLSIEIMFSGVNIMVCKRNSWTKSLN